MPKDSTLDLEKLIVRAADMEAKLHPMLSSIAEFEKELIGEQKALQEDEEELKILESNAISEEQRRIEKLRSVGHLRTSEDYILMEAHSYQKL